MDIKLPFSIKKTLIQEIHLRHIITIRYDRDTINHLKLENTNYYEERIN